MEVVMEVVELVSLQDNTKITINFLPQQVINHLLLSSVSD